MILLTLACVAKIEHDGGKAERAAADIRDEDAVRAVVSDIVTRHGRIHRLVNNAGGQFPSPLMFITKKGFDAVLATNLTGGFVMMRAAPECAMPGIAKRGQLLPRERVARLLDHGAPFLELSTLAGFGMHDDDGASRVMGGGSIAGIGVVSGKRVLVLANDSAIKGGSISPMGMKVMRVSYIRTHLDLPGYKI